jgi:uncharacterized YigZ family protein
MSSYEIPKERVRVETRAGNSRFVATIAPAFSAREAQDFVREIRAEMPDATHHVYAFKIGHGASVSEGMSDDGEPSGTSGPPALAVVRGSGVGDVALVITRYFGGTKLGTGGLVAAYTAAAQAAFAAVDTELKVIRVTYALDVPYAQLESTRRLLNEHECRIDDEAYADHVAITFAVPEQNVASLIRAVHDLTAGQVTPRAIH